MKKNKTFIQTRNDDTFLRKKIQRIYVDLSDSTVFFGGTKVSVHFMTQNMLFFSSEWTALTTLLQMHLDYLSQRRKRRRMSKFHVFRTVARAERPHGGHTNRRRLQALADDEDHTQPVVQRSQDC